MAFYDPLTNLPNRRLLFDRLHQAMTDSTRSKLHGTLLFIDLDNFKILNDRHGHGFGDMFLQCVADRLVANVREGDTVARLGGDEFVVMLKNLSENIETAASQTAIACKKLMTALNQPYGINGHEYLCTTSIGAAMFADCKLTEDDLLKQADIAMYQAKNAGRNRLCFFDESIQTLLIRQVILETETQIPLGQTPDNAWFGYVDNTKAE